MSFCDSCDGCEYKQTFVNTCLSSCDTETFTDVLKQCMKVCTDFHFHQYWTYVIMYSPYSDFIYPRMIVLVTFLPFEENKDCQLYQDVMKFLHLQHHHHQNKQICVLDLMVEMIDFQHLLFSHLFFNRSNDIEMDITGLYQIWMFRKEGFFASVTPKMKEVIETYFEYMIQFYDHHQDDIDVLECIEWLCINTNVEKWKQITVHPHYKEFVSKETIERMLSLCNV